MGTPLDRTFVAAKRALRNAIGLFLTQAQYARVSAYFFRLRQMLDPEERAYFRIKAFSEADFNARKGEAKVLILGLRTFSAYDLSVFEKVLSDALKHNGAEVKILICDNVLDSCDVDVKGCATQKSACYVCKKGREKYKKNYKNEYVSFARFTSLEEIESTKTTVAGLNDDELINFKYLGVNLNEYAVESTIKYFRKGNFDGKSPEHLKVLRHYTIQGIISLNVAKRVIETENPTHFVSLHGCYVSWGPFAEYCLNKGIHIVTYNYIPHKMGCCSFATGKYSPPGVRLDLTVETKRLWACFKEKELSEDQKKKIRDFLWLKKQGKTLDYKLYNMGKSSFRDRDKIRELLDSNKRKFVLCPNLLWDIGLEMQGSGFFTDIYDWMYRTIEYFTKNKESFLLIKPHPGEASIGYTEEGVNEVILQHFGTLPDNILFIPKDYPVTSFDLSDKGCILITYNGTVGLECSYFKKPVLVGGNSHYVEAEAAFRVNSREEYFDCIKDPKKLYDFPVNNSDLIEKYGYFYYFRLPFEIPFLRKDMWLGHWIDWDKLSNYEEFIKNDASMNHLAQAIIDKRSIVAFSGSDT